MSIPFTQFFQPHGRKEVIQIDRPEPIETVAQMLIKAGYRFEIEVLTTGEVSMEILKDVLNPDAMDSLAIKICPNGPTTGKPGEEVLGVPETVDALIQEAFERLNSMKVLW